MTVPCRCFPETVRSGGPSAVVHFLLFIAAVGVPTLFAGMAVTESSGYARSVDDEADRTVAEIAIVTDPAAEKVTAGATLDPGEHRALASVGAIDPATGIIDQDDTNESLSLHETGETTITPDAGWDDDAIDVARPESSGVAAALYRGAIAAADRRRYCGRLPHG